MPDYCSVLLLTVLEQSERTTIYVVKTSSGRMELNPNGVIWIVGEYMVWEVEGIILV